MKLIILDRDGVINEDSPDFIKSTQEWRPLPGSLEAIARLCHAGWRVVVATNQSGIGRGLFDFGALFAMHDKMSRMLAEVGGRIDGVFFCPHTPEDNCRCRKPKTGLYEDIARRFQIDLANVPAVGDSIRDIRSAQDAGAMPILVKTGNGAETLREYAGQLAGVAVHDNLGSVAAALLAAK
ncbi:MAG: D-glycero-beta-D-manno-heptose 1,7-bisphosphate 7-phosphatase [Nevskiales bacterium]